MFRERRQPDGTLVIDLVGDLGCEFTQRIVGQFGHMHDRVHTGQILGRDTA